MPLRGDLGGILVAVSDRDLSALPDDLRAAAIFRNDGQEVMWPRHFAPRVVNALADAGVIVLGLDLRSDGEGSTPPGVSTEIAWSAFRAGEGDQVEAARSDALRALDRLRTKTELDAYGWVLVTW